MVLEETDDENEFVRAWVRAAPLGILEVADEDCWWALVAAAAFGIVDDLIPLVANPGAFRPDREFALAEFISAKPACGIRDLLTERDSMLIKFSSIGRRKQRAGRRRFWRKRVQGISGSSYNNISGGCMNGRSGVAFDDLGGFSQDRASAM